MAGQHFLFVPGPSNVPTRVTRAMAVPMEDHRSPNFPQLTLEVLNGLKKVFKTNKAFPIIFPSSGTGCWEAALTNTLNPGDKVLVSRFGQFSHLWADMCVRLGFDTDIIEVEWGQGAPVDEYRNRLNQDKNHLIKAVLVCHNETATGVVSDIQAIRQVLNELKHPALLMVDTVSSLGSIDFQMDAWEVDVCVSGSQKGLMLPAGMGVTCVSEKAIEASKESRYPRCYFDYQDMLNNNAKGYFPYTPSIPMLYGLRESLRIIEEEGLDNILNRHQRLASGVRAAVTEGWQLSLCAVAPQWYSNSVSAIVVPDGVDAVKVIARAYQRYQLSLGAGLARLSGKVFRIGHLGDLNELMLIGAIAGAEMAMIDEGVKVERGSGVAAAMKVWQS
ncbi:MAG: serine--glyoxylate aminotransferase [Ferrovum sp. 37-45-19]|uniref:aminotransferase class V-fold PLP-dependent enzyme n=1 Tax=Ferrovum sp. JA12 TaxID=1356299 RepID=UPI0007030674|nr:aminotransferase class V-fold PLP-dependent enzyme [Ferrovum sp. JA12]OYV79884.1 MAG: serine--glyoxylate aminotransferase [Ferrovum sp. 21-44-67]OYV95509.1 MAG: serine--glyoxylate aminotransferase [Ferrovum sp. 37-45-19]OZB31553.1 MAG: serine--glyoxylate aminotransferase [Ferrovum sp. 34-44-207]HQT81306.1 aminotransferase class V-fold PLP-dependent enzyme [Ferrovaceae bacterium]KRH78194.1 serine-pyruvate aminotransferase [Ferrovum sp. JA12]